ncbi:MAG: PhzF family phenazine biosynthesis protein [Gillisia sp.]|nr:PhzF family phenazine biosynthesis protein [Gillisia sp.]
MLKIARENAVAETAFFVEAGEKIHLRWFTPETEMDLSDHATLATVHALHSILDYHQKNLVFTTKSGDLEVFIKNDRYNLKFPSRKPLPTPLPELMEKAINIKPAELLKARDFVLVYPLKEDIRNIEINRLYFDQLDLGTGRVIFTAKETDCDLISRFFTPGASVFEDPVTGSAHCSLIPYWSEKLDKTEMKAKQISDRGGSLFCEKKEERVLISGKARTYSEGFLRTD